MNANEPVGYFRKNYDGDWVEAEAGYEDEAIPLYTHPAKTLTDEEIYEIAMEVQTGFLPQDDTLAFARAILKKVQEKC